MNNNLSKFDFEIGCPLLNQQCTLFMQLCDKNSENVAQGARRL